MNNLAVSRDGIQIQKGFMLTEDYIMENFEVICQWMDHFLQYPDLFLDLITPQESNFRLYFYQRIVLRAFMRYRYVFATYTRAFSKSFLAILSRMLQCIFLPNTKTFVCTDIKASGTKIATEKVNEILGIFPFLSIDILTKHQSTDYIELLYRDGSMFDVINGGQGTRGIRRTSGVFEEAVLLDGDEINERVLPTLNINRKDAAGNMHQQEPTQQQLWITSAGPKACFAYEKNIEIAVMAILRPEEAFVLGGDYRVPVAAGLLNKSYIEDIKMSSTFREESFAREYLSIWTGASSDSWINTDRLDKHRTLITAEKRAYPQRLGAEGFYLIACDVGRLNANTAVMIYRVNPQDTYFKKTLVWTQVLYDMRFNEQAAYIKRLNQLYHPKEIVIDGNGLGVGLSDYLTDTTVDPQTGQMVGPLGVINDEDYTKKQDKSLQKVLYILKANNQLNTQIHSNFYTQVTSGHCAFLAPQQQIRSKLLETKKGQAMSPVDRAKFLMPYEMTTKLFDEIANLKIKNNINTLQVERITTRILKDRFSAFQYGLFRIKQYQDEYYRSKRRRSRNLSDFLLYTKKR